MDTTTLAKKIETGTQAKHRRVHARQITRLCHVRAVVSIFLARVVVVVLWQRDEDRLAGRRRGANHIAYYLAMLEHD